VNLIAAPETDDEPLTVSCQVGEGNNAVDRRLISCSTKVQATELLTGRGDRNIGIRVRRAVAVLVRNRQKRDLQPMCRRWRKALKVEW